MMKVFSFSCLISCGWLCATTTAAWGASDVGVWTVDSLTRVFREQPARPQVVPQLGAARGEWESFQVVLTGSPQDLRGARVLTKALIGPNGAQLPPPRVLREHYVQVKVSSPQSPLPAALASGPFLRGPRGSPRSGS